MVALLNCLAPSPPGERVGVRASPLRTLTLTLTLALSRVREREQ